MIQKDYNGLILKRVEKSFDQIMPICALVAFVSTIAILMSSIPVRFAAIDTLSGANFMLLSIFRKKVRVEFKILFTIMNPVVIGILSFMDSGFSTAGIALIMVANVVAVLILSRPKSIVVSVASVMLFVFFWYWSVRIDRTGVVNERTAIWTIQLITFIMYLIIIHTIVHSIRNYLFENIEDLDVSVEQIYNLAYFDQLTELPNQHMFKERLKVKVKEDHVQGFLVFINIANLGLINSLFGEHVGDQVIQGAAKLFGECIKETELLGRIEGTEFALWIEETSKSELNKRLDALMDHFYQSFEVPSLTKKVEFYIGHTQYINEMTLEDCFQKTTFALTYAKTHSSPSRVAYDHTLDLMIRYDETMKELLTEAIEKDAFQIHYQAKVNTFTKAVVGVEALARWNPETLGRIGPQKFIPVVEKLNFSVYFGELIIEKAFKDYSKLCRKYHDQIKLSINISPMHFVSNGFDTYIKSRLEKYGIPPEKIVLEITEEIMIADIETVSRVIYELRKMGVQISLDDFGSGYSSLNYLSILDIDEIKIDKSFIDQIAHNEKIEVLLETLIELGKQYRLNIVAEGVETKKQYMKLLVLGCHEIQGYYFSKPEAL